METSLDGGGGSVTVVYIDSVFLLNTLINYLLLLAAARVAGEVFRRGRYALAAAAGGLYACGVFLPGMGFLLHPACKVGFAVFMALIAYGNARRLFRLLLLFLALSCALGGGVVALGMLGSRAVGFRGGILFPYIDLKVVLLSAAACYVVFGFVFRRWQAARGGMGGIVPVTVSLFGRRLSFQALVDTGNALTDPVTGKPVLVAEGARMAPLFPREAILKEEDFRDPASALTRWSRGPLRGRLRLLPYRAVGVEQGLLLCLKADSVTVSGRALGPLLVALSPGPVTAGGSHCALIGAFEGGDEIWGAS